MLKRYRLLIVACISVLFTMLAKEQSGNLGHEEIYSWLRTTAEVVSMVENRAFRKVDFASFFKTALRNAVAEIDAHSAFITNYEEVADSISGNFSGIGINVIGKASDEDFLPIVDVIDGGPAYQAGLKAGDRIIGVNDEKLKGLSTDEVICKLKGKRGSTLNLKISRGKQLLDFTLKRDIVSEQNSFGYHFKKQNIFYVNLKSFSENSPGQIEKILRKINQEASVKGLILDLRNNPGGIMESGIDIASLFLPSNSEIVTTKSKDAKQEASYSTKRPPVLQKNLLVFVLINNFTASAAEILAGALRYHSDKMFGNTDSKGPRPMIFLAGNTSFGKGSVQEVIPVSNGCALKITSMLYFLPDGSIQAKGVIPDIVINQKTPLSREAKWICEAFGQEKTLKRHITRAEVEGSAEDKSNTKIDEEQAKKMYKFEQWKDKVENGQACDEDYQFCDSGQCYDKIQDLDLSSLEIEKNKIFTEKELEQRRQRNLVRDHQIQTTLNMLSMLHMAQNLQPDLSLSRDKSLQFLQANFVADMDMAMEKINP